MSELGQIIGMIIFYSIFIGPPAIFLFLCIKSFVKMYIEKKEKNQVNETLLYKGFVFGCIFISLLFFYKKLLDNFHAGIARM